MSVTFTHVNSVNQVNVPRSTGGAMKSVAILAFVFGVTASAAEAATIVTYRIVPLLWSIVVVREIASGKTTARPHL